MYTEKFLFVFVVILLLGCAAPTAPDQPVVNEPPAAPVRVAAAEAEPAVNEATAVPPATLTPITTEPVANETAVCPADNFIAVQPHPANSTYPDPELSVRCTDTAVVIQTNNIPNFEFVSITPNALSAQTFTFELPLNPIPADTPSDVPLGGPSAISVNGLVIFGPTEAPRDGYRDPYLDQILDYCNGHTAPGGVYHFHARPDCIYETTDGQVGLVLGYAFDGYPILAPYLCADTGCTSVTKLQSSWQDANPSESNSWERHEYVAGSGDLDECNGRLLDDGSYAYFATDTFPYFMGCYYGEVAANNMFGNRPPRP